MTVRSKAGGIVTAGRTSGRARGSSRIIPCDGQRRQRRGPAWACRRGLSCRPLAGPSYFRRLPRELPQAPWRTCAARQAGLLRAHPRRRQRSRGRSEPVGTCRPARSRSLGEPSRPPPAEARRQQRRPRIRKRRRLQRRSQGAHAPRQRLRGNARPGVPAGRSRAFRRFRRFRPRDGTARPHFDRQSPAVDDALRARGVPAKSRTPGAPGRRRKSASRRPCRRPRRRFRALNLREIRR